MSDLNEFYTSGVDDFENDSIFEDSQEPDIIENNSIEDDNFEDFDTEPSNSTLDLFLESKGLVGSKITIENEDGETEEVLFSELPQDDQLFILNSFSNEEKGESNPLFNFSEDEKQFFNELKNNNLTLSQFLDNYKNSIIQEVYNTSSQVYDIDAYSDNELFMLDSKNKFDLTDEEAQSELEKELQNEDIFNKKVAKLRSEYKELETQQKSAQQAEFESNQKQQYEQFSNQIAGIANSLSEFHGIELEDEEKNTTLSYLLDLDESGESAFYKDLNDPNKLYELAWYAKHGKDAFNLIQEFYENEISKLKKEDKPRVIRQNTTKSKEITNINELI